MAAANPEATRGAGQVLSALDLEPVLPRISAPTLVITSDRSPLQSVETVMRYQQKIPKSRLLGLERRRITLRPVHRLNIRPRSVTTA